MRCLYLAAGVLLAACTGPGTDGDTGDLGHGYPSTFTEGKSRAVELEILPEGEGEDLNGDGEPDNNLPKVLGVADVLVSEQDLGREDLNDQMAEAIEAGDLVLLLHALHASGELRLDLLGGAMDDEGVLSVQPDSYDTKGDPRSRLLGAFSSQVAFEVGPADIEVPITFFPDEPPLRIPLREARIIGELDEDGVWALVVGIIPTEQMIDQVVEPLIPEEGTENQTKEELLQSITTLLENEHMSDMMLVDGSPGISAALWLEATAAAF